RVPRPRPAVGEGGDDGAHPRRARRHAGKLIVYRRTDMTADARSLEKTPGYFAERDRVAPERLATVEGVKMLGQVDVRKLMVGEDILLLHVFRKKGLVDPRHRHDDHETVAYLI